MMTIHRQEKSTRKICVVYNKVIYTARGVTAQKTRFDYVVSSLSPEFATEVRDLLLNPPEERPYDTLKAHLVKRTTSSAQHKLQQLISGEELGDRKPSQLLRRMQQLLGDTADATPFLCELFLQYLPIERQDGPRVYRQFHGAPQARRTGRQSDGGSYAHYR